MTARKNGNEEIASLVISLSTLFRLSLAHGQDFVTLKHEIKYISCYLDIQRIRFPHAFRSEIDVPAELLSCRVLKFLLQPLVENSLNHGLRNSLEEGCITVSAHHEGSDLVLQVADDGSGMSDETLAKLLSMIERTDVEENANPFAGGMGIRNVHQRLLLYYGRGLEIESRWEEGTTVTLHIPYEHTEENKEVIE